MKQLLILGLAFLAAISMLSCAPTRPQGEVTYIKTPYIQNLTKTGVVIMWETAQPHAGYLDVDGDLITVKEKKILHEIMVKDLEPGRIYSYTVNDEHAGTFTTMPASDTAEISFAVYGDTRTNPEIHRKVAGQMAQANPRFVIHTGDIVAKGSDLEQWNTQCFGPAAKLLRNSCLFPALGNHEQNSEHYYRYFNLPGAERYYSFDAGCVHFTVLDPRADGEEWEQQKAWLEKDLKQDKHAWKIAVYHYPAFSVGSRGMHAKVVSDMLPLFYKYGVKLVLNGHDHQYARSRPLADPQGRWLVQLVVGGGGAPLYNIRPRDLMLVGEKKHHYILMTATPEHLIAKTIDLEGKTIDAFELKPDEAEGPLPVTEIITVYQLEKDLKAEAIISGAVVPNTVLPCVIKVSPAPVAGLECRVRWDREKTTWHVKPSELTMPLNVGKPTELKFSLDYWGSEYPVLKPEVVLTHKGKEYPVQLELKLPPFREINITEMQGFPRVDGSVTEAEIRGLKVQTGLVKSSANEEADVPTKFYCGVFGQSLYLAFINMEPQMEKMAIAEREKDGPVWQDDCNEVFLMLPGAEHYFQFIVNSAGQRYDGRKKDKSWNGNWQGAAKTLDDRWTSEFLIPIKVLGKELAPGEDLIVRLNMCRNNIIKGEYTLWSRTYGSSHSPEYFGKGIILRK